MKTYPKMKDSGIKWIKKIPEHWDVKRLKFTTKFDLSTVDRHEDHEFQVSICHYPQVYNNEKITDLTELSSGTCTKKEIEKFRLKKDDVLITKDSETPDDIGVPAYVVDDLQNTVCGYHVAQLTTNKKELLGLFLFRFIQSDVVNAYFETESNGVTRFGLGKDSIANLNVVVPSILEQNSISRFIDIETAKIDSEIFKHKKLIEILREKRRNIINQVVTKGLDPNVPMKYSGIEWIGRIPDHWKISKIKYYVTKISSGSTPKGGSEIYEDYGIPLIRSQNVHFDGLHLEDVAYINPQIHSQMNRTHLQDFDVLLNITGASIGRCTYVPENFGEGNVNQHVCIIRTSQKLHYGFLQKYLESELIQNWINVIQVGVSRQGLTFDEIGSLNIPIFEKEEQKHIVSYLDEETTKINSLILNIESQIKKLEEFRQSLISSAVTGKIDVRQEIVA